MRLKLGIYCCFQSPKNLLSQVTENRIFSFMSPTLQLPIFQYNPSLTKTPKAKLETSCSSETYISVGFANSRWFGSLRESKFVFQSSFCGSIVPSISVTSEAQLVMADRPLERNAAWRPRSLAWPPPHHLLFGCEEAEPEHTPPSSPFYSLSLPLLGLLLSVSLAMPGARSCHRSLLQPFHLSIP